MSWKMPVTCEESGNEENDGFPQEVFRDHEHFRKSFSFLGPILLFLLQISAELSLTRGSLVPPSNLG